MARFMGLACVCLGSAVLLLWGSLIEHRASSSMVDFKAFFFNTRVLLQGRDPYNAMEGTQMAESEGVKPKENRILLPNEITFLYPPSALLICAPLAFLSWGTAHIAWMLLNGGSLILAGFLMWELGADYAPLLTGILIGLFLANSESLLFQGNISGIVVGLCLVGSWCFLRNRFALFGVLCLAASMAIKPHDSGLVWLFFLVAGGIYRKRAMQAMLVTAIVGIASVIWVGTVSPNWTHELRSNLAATTARGAANDPGPTSGTTTIVNQGINLQTVFAVFWDEPVFYTFASLLLCGAMLLLWCVMAWRSPITQARSWIALAFLSALSMLPVYHRHHDGKLLMLAVPGCALLFSRHRTAGILGVVITAIALATNADIPVAILTNLEAGHAFSTATFSGKMTMILLARPGALAVLAMAIFYLWCYWKIDVDSVPANPVEQPLMHLMAQRTS